MKASRMHSTRPVLVLAIGLGLAFGAGASRVANAPPPSASAVQSSTAQPAHDQADETASLRQGTITAIDAGKARIQLQGIWVDAPAANTKLLRHGRPAGLDTLRVGESIRFTVHPGTAAKPSVDVIYAP